MKASIVLAAAMIVLLQGAAPAFAGERHARHQHHVLPVVVRGDVQAVAAERTVGGAVAAEPPQPRRADRAVRLVPAVAVREQRVAVAVEEVRGSERAQVGGEAREHREASAELRPWLYCAGVACR